MCELLPPQCIIIKWPVSQESCRWKSTKVVDWCEKFCVSFLFNNLPSGAPVFQKTPSWPLETGPMWKRVPARLGCPVQRRTSRARTRQPPPQASPWKQSRTFCEHRYLLRWDEMGKKQNDVQPFPNTERLMMETASLRIRSYSCR